MGSTSGRFPEVHLVGCIAIQNAALCALDTRDQKGLTSVLIK